MDTYDPNKISFSFGDIDLNENFDPSKINFKFGSSSPIVSGCDTLFWQEQGSVLKFKCSCSEPVDVTKPLKFLVDCTEHYIKLCPTLWQETDGNFVNFDCKCNTLITSPSDFDFRVDCSTAKDINFNFNVEQGDEYNISFDDSIYVTVEHGTQVEYDIELVKAELDFKIEYGEETSFVLYSDRIFNTEFGYGEDVNAPIRTYPIAYYTGQAEYDTGMENFQLSLINSFIANGDYGHGLDANIRYSTYSIIPFNGEYGHELTTNISTSKNLDIVYDFGQVSDTEIVYFESKNLIADVEHGESASLDILTSTIFNVDVSNGNDVDFILTDAPNENFILTFEDGICIDSDISTNYSLPIDISIGESVDFEINLPYRFNIESFSYTGEVFEGDAYYGVAFIGYVENGENVNFELATKTILDFEYVYDTEVNVIVTEGFIYKPVFVMEYGEELKTNIITSNSYPVDVWYGHGIDFNIKGSENLAMLLTMQYGTEFVGDLFYSQSLPIDVYDGSGVDFSLDTREPANPTLLFEYGVEVTMSTLAQNYAYKFDVDQGEQVSVSTIGNVPNNYIYHGEDTEFNIAIATTFDCANSYGEQVSCNLKFAQSEPVGIFNIGHGEDVYSNKIFIPFDPKFTVSMSLDFDVTNHTWMSTIHDLGLKSCCYDEQDILNIDLATEPDYDVYYDTDYKERVQFDLRTNSVLSFRIEDGYEFRAVDESTYMTMDFAIGTEMNTKDIDYELYIELNVGNVVLEPNDISVEINRGVDAIPQMRRMYIGETMEVHMSYTYALTIPDNNAPSIGSALEFNLQTYEAWRVDFYYHHGLEFILNMNYGIKDIQMPIGQSMSVAFYTEPYYFDYGTEMELTEIHTKYDVEMTNSGCLQNKYVELDSNGFPIPNETGIEAIEGQPFMAYIEGRCF